MTRTTVTAASRIMLPTYAIFFTWVGAGWTLTNPHHLTQTPALNYANTLLPINYWGALLTLCGALIATSLITHKRTLCRFALWTAAIVMAAFVAVFTLAVFLDDASPGAPAWPALVAAACLASERSLLRGEHQ